MHALFARAMPPAFATRAGREQFETQRARHRRGFNKPHAHLIAKAVGLAAVVADERMIALVIAEIFVADGARRHKAVGTGVVKLDEEAGAGDAGDAAFE